MLTQDNYSLLTCTTFVSHDGRVSQDDFPVKTRIPNLCKFYTKELNHVLLKCAFLLLSYCIFASDSSDKIFLILSIKRMDAVAAESVSEIGSAQYTPITPMKCGRMIANGIKRMILRSTAIKREIYACPKARKVG